MTINFRRNALQLSVAALFSSAFMANAADIPQVKVTVTDKQCEPMTITVNAGENTVSLFRTTARRRWSGRSSKA